MDSETYTAEARAVVRELEGLIHNCRHGGPPSSDQGTLWFQQSMSLAGFLTPLDALIDQSSIVGNADDGLIRTALVATINTLIDSRSSFRFALMEIGCKKFFASLAVDAWFNEDFVCVRKFLIKSIILGHLQSRGATEILVEISQPEKLTLHQSRRSTLERVKGVLQCHNAGLKGILQFCTDGSCTCIEMAQTLNENKEILLNPNADRRSCAAKRKQREVERLPPILKPSSEYWIIKEKAAAFLKRGKLGESSKSYLEAKAMLEEQKDLNAPMHQEEWLHKIGEEGGKIASNLSMICLRKHLKHKALTYADEAVLACPGWSKSFCRRALALKSLGRLEEAQLAIFNAMKKLPALEDDATKRQHKEYQKIQEEIEVELSNSSSIGNTNQQRSSPVENPLYKPWKSELIGNKVGSIGVLSDNEGVMDIIYSFFTPIDVANLERTCKRFASNLERGRRIAIGSKLLCGNCSPKQSTSAVALENSLVKYINSIDDSSTMALQNFVTEVQPMINDNIWKELLHVRMDPLSFEIIIASALSNTSVDATHILSVVLDLKLASSRDIQIVKYLLRGEDRVCKPLKHTLIDQMSHLLDDEGDEDGGCFSRFFFGHSLDLDVMRLIMSIDYDTDDYYRDIGLKDSASILLLNSLLSKGEERKQKMDQDDPLFVHTMAFHTLFTEHIPNDWPGLIDGSFSWDRDSIEKDSIKQYWMDENAAMFRMWKVAVLKLLKWVHKVEKEGHISDYLLVSRIILGDMINDSRYSPISFYSFGPFLAMRSTEFGGAVSMSVRLRNKEDLTDLFYDFYSFLKLFRTGFPALIEYRDRLLASHYSHYG